jgi:hypothetical protein
VRWPRGGPRCRLSQPTRAYLLLSRLEGYSPGDLCAAGAAARRGLSRAETLPRPRRRQAAAPANAGPVVTRRYADPGTALADQREWARPTVPGDSFAAQRSPPRALAALGSSGWRCAPLLTVIFHGESLGT